MPDNEQISKKLRPSLGVTKSGKHKKGSASKKNESGKLEGFAENVKILDTLGGVKYSRKEFVRIVSKEILGYDRED